MDAEADMEALACLPPLAPQIGALLRRPGLTSQLHAAEPYAAASLVTAVLRATCMLRGTPASVNGQLTRHLRTCTAPQGTASASDAGADMQSANMPCDGLGNLHAAWNPGIC